MRTRQYPDNGWYIKCVDHASDSPDAFRIDELNYDAIRTQTDQWHHSLLPTSVQEILVQNRQLPLQARYGNTDMTWVAEHDWVYMSRVTAGRCTDDLHAELVLKGIDTIADVYMNGRLVSIHNDMYLQGKIDVSDCIKDVNDLVIYFHSPNKRIRELEADLPVEWQGYIANNRLIRKAKTDFQTFLGNRYPCTCVGLYDEVWLDMSDRAWMTCLDLSFTLSQDNQIARLHAVASAAASSGSASDFDIRFQVMDPAGNCILDRMPHMENGQAVLDETISQPLLWWPRNYGGQPLYRVRASLEYEGRELEFEEKRIGFRRIQYSGNFNFDINGRPIRIWGSNMVNVDGISHWCDRERVSRLMEYASKGNMNILRVWGEGPLLPDLFYDLADEQGILVWQDFALGFGLWPSSEPYRALFRKEAEQLVMRLKHHASLLLWCGSNEMYMVGVSDYTEGKQIGFEMIFEDAPQICARLDPGTLYIPSSPMGGAYPQDATEGDIHGYWGNDFEPGVAYPVLFSESCHATAYARHSMRRFMSDEEIWPVGYHDTHVYKMDFDQVARKGKNNRLIFTNYWRQISVPDTWKNHLSEFAPSELWNLEQYFDAKDADSILYKFSVCGADFFKNEIERIRIGHPCRDSHAKRICNGYLTWKFNDAWPHINFTLIDYFLEPTAQYYAVKRAYAPLLAGVAVEQDQLYLWGVNDSSNDWEGTITLRLFSRVRNRIEKTLVFPVALQADTSKIVDCLNRLGSLHREYVLHTQLADPAGQVVGTNVTYLDMERNLSFPDSTLTLAWEDGQLLLTTDWYARHIVLTGRDGDDEFGWEFDDNYFDLLPFETKRIHVGGVHSSGVITAKSNYSSKTATIAFPAETNNSKGGMT